MDSEFWRSRWQAGRIGFHQGHPNGYLAAHADRLANYPRVLVPLCGKTEDLAFLASRGHDVVGIELVEDAVRAFFAEHAIEPHVATRDGFVEYAAPPLTILAGDLFGATRAIVGPIDAIYDRAALVALPDQVRRRYVDLLRTLAPKPARVLLVTYEYDQSKMEGPPFSVTEAEVRSLYDGTELELLSEGPDARDRPDMPPAIERCFAITL